MKRTIDAPYGWRMWAVGAAERFLNDWAYRPRPRMRDGVFLPQGEGRGTHDAVIWGDAKHVRVRVERRAETEA